MRAPISSLKIVPVLLALNPYLLGETLFLTVATDARLFRTVARQEREVFDTGDEGRLAIGDYWYRLLLDSMFDLPSLAGVKEVVIFQQVVEGTAGPLYMYGGGMRAS